MASYIYSKVQEAIGGKSTSSGFQKGWSPNKIRALYIMRDFILVVDYLSGPKLMLLHPFEVAADLENLNRVGSLNNLLSSRQLSCLEEIYADEAFSRFPNVLDLQAYANSVVNSASRLRYYAYTSGIDGEELRRAYYKAFTEGTPDFTYAKNIGGIRYVDTGNTDWYKKHNLRPQYYGPDADGGNLAAWFNKVEKIVAKSAQDEANKHQQVRDQEYIMQRVIVDIAAYPAIVKLGSLMAYCNKTGYELYKGFYSIAEEATKSYKPVSGLSKDKVVEAARATGNNSSDFILSIKCLVSYYEHAGLFLADAPFDLNKLIGSNLYPEESGFLQVGRVFDRILAGVYEKYGSNPTYKYIVNVGIMNAFPEGVPEGYLSKRLQGRVRTVSGDTSMFIGSYLKAFCYICGVPVESLRK